MVLNLRVMIAPMAMSATEKTLEVKLANNFRSVTIVKTLVVGTISIISTASVWNKFDLFRYKPNPRTYFSVPVFCLTFQQMVQLGFFIPMQRLVIKLASAQLHQTT